MGSASLNLIGGTPSVNNADSANEPFLDFTVTNVGFESKDHVPFRGVILGCRSPFPLLQQHTGARHSGFPKISRADHILSIEYAIINTVAIMITL
jgi:hypothetical protein